MTEADAGTKRSTTEVALKWIAAITALLSLVFAIQKFMQLVGEENDRQRRIGELTATTQMQQQAGDYATAWETSEQGLKAAESGGTVAKMLGKVDASIRQQRELRQNLAMDWLRNARTSNSQSFTLLANKVLPTLNQGATAVTGQRQADLLAHIGWAYFLRSREGGSGGDPRKAYEGALSSDAGNPYAHAFLGHYIVWKDDNLPEAQKHFAAALAGNREREFVRSIQLAALRNQGSRGDVPMVATVGEMLKNKESIPEEFQRSVLSTLRFVCARNEAQELDGYKKALPDGTLVATYSALVQAAETKPAGAEECVARLQ